MSTPETDHIPALRALWRDMAEKGIEQGVDWPRIAQALFADLDAANARLAAIEGLIADAETGSWGFVMDAGQSTYKAVETGLLRDALGPKMSRHCKGSMRTPTRTTTITGGALWGTCRSCGSWCATRHDGTVRIHDARVVSRPGSPGQDA